MQKDGTQSWIVISRSVKKYVTELLEEHQKPIHCEEVPYRTGQLVAMKQKGQSIPSSSSSSSILLLINQRKWNDMPAVGRIDGNAFTISKLMTRLLREDGAIGWRKVVACVLSRTP